MAGGSHKATWKQIGGRRPCDCCGRSIRQDEIGEVRTIINGKSQQTFVWCEKCRGGRDRAKAMIELATSHPTPAVNPVDWWLEFKGKL